MLAYMTDALIAVKALGELNIEHIEQPVAGEIGKVWRACVLGAVPIMADESIVTPSDAYRLVHMGACDVIKIKITKVGGYINARKIIDVCESSGTELVIGQGLCSSIEVVKQRLNWLVPFSHVLLCGGNGRTSKVAGRFDRTRLFL